MSTQADVWRCIREPHRRRIIELLRVRSRTTTELAEALGCSRYLAMKHLGVLREAQLVVSTKEGRKRWNHLDATPLHAVVKPWLDSILMPWSPELLREQGFVLEELDPT